MIRPPAVAGAFYPADHRELQGLLAKLADPSRAAAHEATAVMVPHAGYIYSGAVAGAVYQSIRLPQRYLILCPNHTGQGAEFAAYLHGSWDTPLGRVEVDTDLAESLASEFPKLKHDPSAHEREHSLEVQLPFLQHLAGEIRFVPLCVASHNLSELVALGEAIARVVEASQEPVLLVISSDMSHYIPAEAARKLDEAALAPLQQLDAEKLHHTVHGLNISMCGIAPAVVGVAAARSLGADSGQLIAYANSGDVTGDFQQVVAYAGVVFS